MSYTVTDTRQVQKMTPGNQIRDVYRVWITTGKGATGVVEVPADKWNSDNLPPILEAKAKDLDLAFVLTEE